MFYGAALTEAAAYRDRDVVVVGGANSAGQGAMFFSRYARTVTMLVRGRVAQPRACRSIWSTASPRRRTSRCSPTRVVTGVRGTGELEAITVADLADGRAHARSPAAAMFIFIGTAPRTEMVAGLVERDAQGFILTGRDLHGRRATAGGWPLARDPFLFETSVPGVFAAGDARRGSGKRVAAAVGEGSATVSMIHEYLETV